MKEEGIFRVDEILIHLNPEEKEIVECIWKKQMENIYKEDRYTEEKLLLLLKKLELYIKEKLDIDISIDQYMMGGL